MRLAKQDPGLPPPPPPLRPLFLPVPQLKLPLPRFTFYVLRIEDVTEISLNRKISIPLSVAPLNSPGLRRGAVFKLSEGYIRCHSEHPIWVRPHEGRQASREMRSETRHLQPLHGQQG